MVNSSQGGGTKDTWVLEVLMLGKTAAHIFWMFGYLERCENTARLINASHFVSLTQNKI